MQRRRVFVVEIRECQKCYEELDALFNMYDARVKAMRLVKPKGGVWVLLLKEIKLRVESVSSECQEIPQSPHRKTAPERRRPETSAPPQNTLYMSRKSDMIALVDYRTSNLYDWSEFPHVPMTDERRENWRVYRQALRDFPNQEFELDDDFRPRRVTFPEKPE